MPLSKIKEILDAIRGISGDEFHQLDSQDISLEELLQEVKKLSDKLNYEKTRKNTIIEHIIACCSGDFFNPLEISEKHDELDVISLGFNVYMEELESAMVSKDLLEKSNKELLKEKAISEKLAAAKDDFLSKMSHEIRTPLNGILGFTDLLYQNSNLTKEQDQQLKSIRISSEILLTVFNNILELQNLESPDIKIENSPLSLYESFELFVRKFDQQISEKRLIVKVNHSVDIPRFVKGDIAKISQIFLNIIGNSIKFTPNYGSITIQTSICKIENNSVLINFEIEDSGIGIEEENMETIFEPFIQKTDDYARTFGGTGLGLTVTKKTIDLLKGTIVVESVKGKGTKVTVQIPFQKYLEPIIQENQTINQNDIEILEIIKVLVAEDNSINQLLIKTILQKEGFTVDIADDGQKAVEAVEKNNYNIILMDLMMPNMNGYEAGEHIRTKIEGIKSTIPIIAVSADVTKDVREKCLAVGMNDYVSKPYDAKQLIRKIMELVK